MFIPDASGVAAEGGEKCTISGRHEALRLGLPRGRTVGEVRRAARQFAVAMGGDGGERRRTSDTMRACGAGACRRPSASA